MLRPKLLSSSENMKRSVQEHWLQDVNAEEGSAREGIVPSIPEEAVSISTVLCPAVVFVGQSSPNIHYVGTWEFYGSFLWCNLIFKLCKGYRIMVSGVSQGGRGEGSEGGEPNVGKGARQPAQ